jgi:hypothetical protein
MNARPIALAFLLGLAPAVVPAVAHAQAAQPEDALTKAARARFQEGVDAFDKGNYEAARASFTQAYALKQHPAVLLNLAQSCLKSGHYLEAAKDFQKYIADPQGDKKADAQRGLADARAKLGRLDVNAPPGSEITIDDAKVGNAPLNEAADVEAGNHTVRVRLPDGTSSEQKITVNAGQVLPVKFGGAAATVVSPPPGGGTGPGPENPPPGGGNVTPPPGGGAPPPGGGAPPPGGEEPGPSPSRPLFMPLLITGSVLTVGGFVLAGIFAGLKGSANNNYTSVEQQIIDAANKAGVPSQGLCNNPPSNFKNACDTLQSNANAVNQDATVANVGIAIGVVGLATVAGSVVYYFVAGKSHKTASTFITPWLAPQTGGLSFGGAF